MGRELLPPAALTPSAEKRQRFKGLLALIYAAACASFIVWAVSLTSNSSTRQSRHHVIPMNAQQILDECAALYTLPGIITSLPLPFSSLHRSLIHNSVTKAPRAISGSVVFQIATTLTLFLPSSPTRRSGLATKVARRSSSRVKSSSRKGLSSMLVTVPQRRW